MCGWVVTLLHMIALVIVILQICNSGLLHAWASLLKSPLKPQDYLTQMKKTLSKLINGKLLRKRETNN